MKAVLPFALNITTYIILLSVVISNMAYSQVAGISASKIGTYCVETVPVKDLEFEPSFAIGKSSKQWNAENNLEQSFSTADSSQSYSEYVVRCTYGLTNKLEIGLSAPADASELSFGTKYIAFENNKIAVAIISGINLPHGNHIYNQRSIDPHYISSFASGIVLSYKLNEKLLIDFDLQGQTLLKNAKENNHYDLFVNSDLGYYINEHTQLICGLSYYNNFYNNYKLNKSLFDIHPGISYETGDNFLIVLSSPVGIYGKNVSQSYGINIAFTMTIR